MSSSCHHRWASAGRSLIAAGLAAWVLSASALSPSLAQAPPPDPRFEAAKAAFEALPEADRRVLQDSLVWTGDYTSTISGGFGRRTYDGILAFQRRARLEETGILDDAARRGAKAAADRAREAAGFEAVLDPRSGLRIGVPRKRLSKVSANPAGGSRYQSADDRATLDTRTAEGGEAELKALYERNLAIRTPGRKVTYRLLRPDFFVITGETPAGRFYTRYAAGPGGLRGFSLGYDKALARDYEPLVVAVANSFEPFPAPDRPRDPAPGPAASAPVPAPIAPEPSAPATGAAGFTGLYVGPRLILTSAGVAECREVQAADGGRLRVSRVDRERGIALVETDRERRRPSLALAPADVAEGWVLFVARDEGVRVVATPAEASADGTLVAALQPGAAGAVVLDRAGRLAGLVTSYAEPARRVAGLVPPTAYPFASAGALKAAGVDVPAAPSGAAAPRTLGAVAAEVAPSLVALTCPPVARRP